MSTDPDLTLPLTATVKDDTVTLSATVDEIDGAAADVRDDSDVLTATIEVQP